MRRLILALALSAAALTVQAQTVTQAPAEADPYLWLEEVEGERALTQVRAWNARSLAVLEADPTYADLHAKALAIVNAADRIPSPALRGDRVDNFWQDKTNVRGLWRRTTLEGYRAAEPAWDTVLDLDALSAAEKANWVYKGADCLQPDATRCLVNLSDGGKDAVEMREFDVSTKTFVDGGFRLPAGKQRVSWGDRDTLYVAREWGPETMTDSGYPFVLKRLARGAALDSAVEVFRGAKTDALPVTAADLRDPDGSLAAIMLIRGPSFFDFEYSLLTDGGPVRLPFPTKSSLDGYVAGQVIVSLKADWTQAGDSFKTGDLVSVELAALKRNPATAKATLIRRPGPRDSIEQVASTRSRLLVAAYENVRGALYAYTFANGRWTPTKFALPENSSITVAAARDGDETVFVSVTNFLQPTTLYEGDAATGRFTVVKQLAPKFDATGMQVQQFEATSKDGTKIPYFVVRKPGTTPSTDAPTLLYAYGGFEIAMTPGYSAMVGKLWLERGGVYVLANIRGGGEFGPKWHQAGLLANRQRVYDDFGAVSRDLVAREITTADRLGIQGGSNGGLLMGVALTQYPELYNATIVQVPLLDMLRYDKLLAGASWTGEYGDPDVPAERATLETYSPYQRLRAGLDLPEPFIVTSTKDDRVHPGHARKFAAKLEALGYPFLYYENIDGGHSAAANLQETARRTALEYTYLTRKLMPATAPAQAR